MSTFSQEQTAQLTGSGLLPAVSAAYQELYINIALSWRQGLQHTISLTTPSPYPEQGLAAVNTAIAAAQNGTFTILLDADLQTPTLHRYFNVHTPGLSDLHNNEEFTPQSLSPYLCKTAIADLLLLGTGQEQLVTAEIGRFFTTRFAALLAGLRQVLQARQHRPGLLIVSSPPVLSGSNASLISAQIEQTFLFIVAGRTTRTEAKKAQGQLEKAHANLAGMILLDV